MIKKMLRKWLLDEEPKGSSEPQMDPVKTQEEIDAERQRLKESDEPYCEVIGEGIEDGQLKLQLDWNEPFIQFLLENGFTGKNDEDIVSKWMLMVHRELGESAKEGK